MDNGIAEYRGLDAVLNDASTVESLMSDVQFYVDEVRRVGGPVLELCGFEADAPYGDFGRRQFRHGREQVWVVKKRSDQR